MKINSVTINTNTNQNRTFKKGLTFFEVNDVKRMGADACSDIQQKLKLQYGMDADFKGTNTVAYCVDKTAEIMHRAGFELPKNFEFRPLGLGVLGCYNPIEDKVSINSGKYAFSNLEEQNKMEESMIGYHPISGHFLQTYLHEFSHAAHYKNLCKNSGANKGWECWRELADTSPNDIIVAPMNKIIKSQAPKFANKIIDKVFPNKNGIYAKSDVLEYFAEMNARHIANVLGDRFIISNIPSNFTSYYKSTPKNWNLVGQFSNSMSKIINEENRGFFTDLFGHSIFGTSFQVVADLVEIAQKQLRYIDGDIWHGNESGIELMRDLSKHL